jgi:hypothetical protein
MQATVERDERERLSDRARSHRGGLRFGTFVGRDRTLIFNPSP